MGQSGATPLPDRRRADRRADVRVADLTLPELRRMLVTTTLFAIVAALAGRWWRRHVAWARPES